MQCQQYTCIYCNLINGVYHLPIQQTDKGKKDKGARGQDTGHQMMGGPFSRVRVG